MLKEHHNTKTVYLSAANTFITVNLTPSYFCKYLTQLSILMMKLRYVTFVFSKSFTTRNTFFAHSFASSLRCASYDISPAFSACCSFFRIFSRASLFHLSSHHCSLWIYDTSLTFLSNSELRRMTPYIYRFGWRSFVTNSSVIGERGSALSTTALIASRSYVKPSIYRTGSTILLPVIGHIQSWRCSRFAEITAFR